MSQCLIFLPLAAILSQTLFLLLLILKDGFLKPVSPIPPIKLVWEAEGL